MGGKSLCDSFASALLALPCKGKGLQNINQGACTLMLTVSATFCVRPWLTEQCVACCN